MVELRDKQDATSRYTLAALILSNESVIGVIRRELRRVVDVLVDEKEIVKALHDEVIKRDTVEGPNAEAALRRVNRAEAASQRGAKVKREVAAVSVDAPPKSEERGGRVGRVGRTRPRGNLAQRQRADAASFSVRTGVLHISMGQRTENGDRGSGTWPKRRLADVRVIPPNACGKSAEVVRLASCSLLRGGVACS